MNLGCFVTFGIASVPVYAKPKVVILSTGSELLNVDEPIVLGKLRDSNGVMLAGQVSQVGGEPQFISVLPRTK
ncbi:molybdopterin biosynthesis enzyme [Bacillus alveayuensis]|uniref:Molybdopterin molybdenumtransferase n=1 Tax=Aeribacillus alveayuensis TaxID=279215 RepID=A0ABT9VRY7_9BACI|nr:molybdopterin biosynthesis enzyme [Bacillus alveayuensis]